MIKKARLCIAILINLFTYNYVYSQNVGIILNGKIVDNKKEPLPFASVSISSGRIGIICNSSGLFTLKVPDNYIQDTLVISFVGYEIRKIPISAFATEGSTLLIQLQEKIFEMNEVVVKHINASKLIQSAILKISENYFHTPHVTKGFYRVDTKKDAQHIQLSEAVFDIYNYGLGSNKESQLKLLKMRRLKDEKGSHGIDFGMNTTGVLQFDIVNTIGNSEIFSTKELKNYVFELDRVTEFNGAEAYEISFDQKDGLKRSLYKGKIYLDKANLAFVSLQLLRSPKGIRYAKYGASGTRALMKILGINMNLKKESFKVDYKKFGSKWTLSSVKNISTLLFKSNREHYDFEAKIDVDYVISEIDTTQKAPFKAEEVLGDNKFIEFQGNEPEPNFWKDYNIILADYDVSKVIENIQAKNNSFTLKKRIEQRLSKLPKNHALRIDSILTFYHHNGHFNGNALVQSEGRIILSKHYGFGNTERKTPLSNNSEFRIGSLTKSFTAMLIQQLSREGKLKLSDTIGKFIPEYIHKNVTMEQLLTHTSGIPNFTTNNDYLIHVMTKDLTLKEIVLSFCSDSLEFTSGEGFRYSNSGYVVLAAVIETVTGHSYGQVLKKKIFEPLKMEHTSFGLDSLNTLGYYYGKPEPKYKIRNMAGAGGMSSTADDLVKWDEALSNNILIQSDKTDDMFKPRAEYTEWDAYYGYGWMIDRFMFKGSKKHTIIYHPGTDFGYYSMFVRQPDKKILIVLLNNTGDFARFDMSDLILEEINR